MDPLSIWVEQAKSYLPCSLAPTSACSRLLGLNGPQRRRPTRKGGEWVTGQVRSCTDPNQTWSVAGLHSEGFGWVASGFRLQPIHAAPGSARTILAFIFYGRIPSDRVGVAGTTPGDTSKDVQECLCRGYIYPLVAPSPA